MEEKIPKSIDYELDSINNSNSSPPNNEVIDQRDANSKNVIAGKNSVK